MFNKVHYNLNKMERQNISKFSLKFYKDIVLGILSFFYLFFASLFGSSLPQNSNQEQNNTTHRRRDRTNYGRLNHLGRYNHRHPRM